MSPGPTFDRVYRALKEQLISGQFAPGAHLEPALIGRDLNASITPVRDALHRLVGERLVEAPRNDGFRTPAPTEAELRGLFRWQGELLALALRQRPRRHRRHEAESAGSGHHDTALIPTVAEVFHKIGRRSEAQELSVAIDSVGDRLGPIRAAERLLFDDLEAEASGLHQAYQRRDATALRKCISAYHRRRVKCVPELLVASQRHEH